jgi:hypothetical protein
MSQLNRCPDGLTEEQARREACEASRRATESIGLDDLLRGNRREQIVG